MGPSDMQDGINIDPKELGALAGILATVWAFLRWILTPLIRESLKKVLEEDLIKIRVAAEAAGKCADRWEAVTEKLERIETDVEQIENLMSDARENINAMWVIFDNVLGVERRHEVRRRVDIPPIINHRQRRRREEDSENG